MGDFDAVSMVKTTLDFHALYIISEPFSLDSTLMVRQNEFSIESYPFSK